MSPATFTDASGDKVTITLKGPGSGRVRFTNARPADAAGIDLTGTSAASALVIKTGPAGTTTTGDVTVEGSLKALTGKTADLTGDIAVSGSLGKLLLRNADAPGAKAVTIGAGAATTMTLASVSGLAIHSAAPVKALKVKGELVGADVRSASSIGKITAAAIRNSRIFAGVADSRSTLPGSASDFVNAAASIAAVSVKSRIGSAFSNTLIAAPTIGKLSLGAIDTANNGAPFGVAADRIGSVAGIAVGGVGALKRSKLNDPTGSLADGDFVVRLI